MKDLTAINNSLIPKMSSGPDGIPSKIIKIIIETIPNQVLSLINKSLKTGNIHQRFKNSTIVPIYKADNKHDINNYRPISLINSISKICKKATEKPLRDQLTSN